MLSAYRNVDRIALETLGMRFPDDAARVARPGASGVGWRHGPDMDRPASNAIQADKAAR